VVVLFGTFRDFQDYSRNCAVTHPFHRFRFPKQSISLWEPNTRVDGERESKCRQLEYFLRTLCAMIYRENMRRQRNCDSCAVVSRLRGALFCEDLASTATAPTESSLWENRQVVTLAMLITRGYVCFSAGIQRYIGCFFCWTQCARLSTALCRLCAPVGLAWKTLSC
jgi:hypothetical protein